METTERKKPGRKPRADKDIPELEVADGEQGDAPEVHVEAADPAINPQHERRMKEAARQAAKKQKNRPVKDTWYEYVLGQSYDPKKGRKLVMKKLTATGAMSTYVGFEKKIPAAFMKKIKAENLLRENVVPKP